jgi:glycosyltransferase involved in cell wall biosynthesis
MKLIFWQNMLSHLQSAHVRALSLRPDVQVTIIGMDEISPNYKALGWAIPDFGSATVVQSPAAGEIPVLIRDVGPKAIHLLAGWRGLRHGRLLLRELKASGARHGLLTEGGDVRGWRGWARRAVYFKDRVVQGGAFDFIIAMGEQGLAWFRQSDYPAARLFPYAYITETPQVPPLAAEREGPVEILYLGQCVKRKAMDLALRALAQLRHHDWRLTLVGDGEAADEWRTLAVSLQIRERVRFLSALPYAEAVAHLALADLLVLPSRFDGWGAVVNEALMAGVPVICSDRCGAKDLIAEPWRGSVFRCGSVASLTRSLEQWVARGRRSAAENARIRRWASCLQGDQGADYLLAVFAHVYEGADRPIPPWIGTQPSSIMQTRTWT